MPWSEIDFSAELNAEQYAAVSGGDGHCLVIAGPGSGKTRVLVYRLAWLVSHGVPPDSILLLTFTNKAAREMLERSRRLLGRFPAGLTGGTFHHAGNLCLRRWAASLGYPNDFVILDRADSRDLISKVVREKVGRPDRFFPKPEVISSLIGYAANSCLDLREVVRDRYAHFLPYLPRLEAIALGYREAKRNAGAMDFDDLLANWLTLLRENDEAREHYQEKFRHVLVDEFQDTNRLQFETIRLLSARHGNLMVVGDDAQSIYSFRAADIRNALDFPEVFPGSRVMRLETNYRSTPEILSLANGVISHNTAQFPKVLREVLPPGRRPVVLASGNEWGEARRVAAEIEKLSQEGFPPGEIAVLFRNRYQSARLEKELVALRRPYVIRGGLRFYEQAHAKDALAFLRVLVHRRDELSWRRVMLLRDGFGDALFRRLWGAIGRSPDPVSSLSGAEAAAAVPKRLAGEIDDLARVLAAMAPSCHARTGGPLRALVQEYYAAYCEANFPNARERISDISEMAAMADGSASLAEFIDQVVMGEEVYAPGKIAAADTLTLSTIHQAKGLEWRAVFVIGLCEGAFPSGRCLEEGDQLEEERRLFFVAVTRARERLCLTYPREKRDWGGGDAWCEPSRFLDEMPDSSFEEAEPDPDDDGPGGRFRAPFRRGYR